MDRAFKKLDQLKSQIVWWESGAQPAQLLSSGEVTVASAYNGRITTFNKAEKAALKIVWPDSIYAPDSWVILAGSPNAKDAMDLVAYMSTAEHQAKLPTMLPYGLTNKAAAAAVPADLQTDLPTNPANMEHAIPLDVDFWIDNSEALTQRFNAWLAQ